MFTSNKAALDMVNITFGEGVYSDPVITHLNSRNMNKTDGTVINFSGTGTWFYRFAYAHDNSISNSIIAQTATVSQSGGSESVYTGALDVVVGSGATAPTSEDYALESQILTLEHISVALTTDHNRNVVTRTFRNTDSAAITIREVGIITRLKPNLRSTGTQTLYPLLLARYVLPTPLTVASGALFSVVAEI